MIIVPRFVSSVAAKFRRETTVIYARAVPCRSASREILHGRARILKAHARNGRVIISA